MSPAPAIPISPMPGQCCPCRMPRYCARRLTSALSACTPRCRCHTCFIRPANQVVSRTVEDIPTMFPDDRGSCFKSLFVSRYLPRRQIAQRNLVARPREQCNFHWANPKEPWPMGWFQLDRRPVHTSAFPGDGMNCQAESLAISPSVTLRPATRYSRMGINSASQQIGLLSKPGRCTNRESPHKELSPMDD